LTPWQPLLPGGRACASGASFSGFADDRTVDLGVDVDAELIGILGSSPRLDFTGGTLSLGDLNLSIPGAASPIQVTSSDVEAVLSGGPVWGTPVGGVGFEPAHGVPRAEARGAGGAEARGAWIRDARGVSRHPGRCRPLG
jgi:hypothetical protein